MKNVKELITSKIGVAVITGFICLSLGGIISINYSKDNEKLKAKVQELENKLIEAKPYFEMKETERQAIVFETIKKQEELKKEQEKLEKEKKEAEAEKQRKLTEGVLVYENDAVKINFKKVTRNGVEFFVENKTDKAITIQADAISVNGISYNQIIMSDDVSPKSKGLVKAECSIEVPEVMQTIGGQLRIIDMTSFNSENATFTNVDVAS